MTCNSSVVTVAPAISSSPAESSISQAPSPRAHAKAQPEGSHSFAHALREGLNKNKDESKDVPKPKKAAQQPTGKDGLTPASSDKDTVAATKPLTGKFGFANMLPDPKPVDTKTATPEADSAQDLAKGEAGENGSLQADSIDASNAQASSLPSLPVAGPLTGNGGNPILMAMLTQSHLGDLNLSHGSKNEALLTSVDLANSPVLAPSLSNLAAVQNASSSPSSAQTSAGAEQPGQLINDQLLQDATASSDGSTSVAATALPGHLAFALRLSAGTLNTQSHTSSSVETTSLAPLSSVGSMPSIAPVATVSSASSDKPEEQGSGAPPQHERSLPDSVVQPSTAQASQSDIAPPTNETVAGAAAPEMDDKFDEASTEPVRNLNMQVIGEGNRRVNIALLDRSGELRVSVHSADKELNQQLQDKMPELTSQLEGQKYDTQVWMPRRQNGDSQNQEDSKQQDRPAWVEELQRKSGKVGRNQSSWLQ